MRVAEGTAEAEVISARSPLRCRFYGAIMRRQMRRHFHAIRVAKPGLPRLPKDQAVIFYSNHPSWWDPALFIILTTRFLRDRKGYGPIDSRELKRYSFMRRIGVFGIELGTQRAAAEFFHTSSAILSDCDTVLWITAEGAFTDPRQRPILLQPGTAHLMARLRGIAAIPMAIEYPFWTERLPEVLCRFGEPLQSNELRSISSWEARLEEQLTKTMDALATDAMTKDPDRFELILRGRTGIGGIYDVFRRGRAWARGERFVAEHGSRKT